LISSAVTLADFDSFVARAMAASAGNPDVTEELLRSTITIGIIVGLVFVALQVLFLWFAWKGHNWARIVLWVLGGLSLTFGLIGLAGGSGQTGFTTSMSVFQLLFTAAGVILLAMKPSHEWYRFRSWQRANGQG
jgi:cytochrome c oxidase assembly factor CtaG